MQQAETWYRYRSCDEVLTAGRSPGVSTLGKPVSARSSAAFKVLARDPTSKK